MKQQVTRKKVLPLSKEAKARIAIVAKKLEGRELFPEKIERAKQTFNRLKSMPS